MTKKKRKFITFVKNLKVVERIENRMDLNDAKKALANARKKGTVSWESIKRKLDL